MELFREFFAIAEAMNEEGLEYSVVGGIAMAFNSEPRFTRDIGERVMASRIERVVREVSDLRNFYLSLQRSRRIKPNIERMLVSEPSAVFGKKEPARNCTDEGEESEMLPKSLKEKD